jgi:hypothetical protein
MITSEKLAIYKKFGGDEDGWSRAGSPGVDVVSFDDWLSIRNLLQELTMLKQNLASKQYADEINKRLAETVADPEALKALLDLA